MFFEGQDEVAQRQARAAAPAHPSTLSLCSVVVAFSVAVASIPATALFFATRGEAPLVALDALRVPEPWERLARRFRLGVRARAEEARGGGDEKRARTSRVLDVLEGDWCEGLWSIGRAGASRGEWERPCETGEDEFARLRVRADAWTVLIHECRDGKRVVMDAQRNVFRIRNATDVRGGFGLFVMEFLSTTSELPDVRRRVGACSLHCVVPTFGEPHWKGLPKRVHAAVAADAVDCDHGPDLRTAPRRCNTANESGAILELVGPCAWPEGGSPPPPKRRKATKKKKTRA